MKDVTIFPLAAHEDEMILKKPSSLLVAGSGFTTLQTKIYYFFLFIAEKTLERDDKERSFAFALSDLRKILNMQTNNEYIKEAIKKMLDEKIRYKVSNDFADFIEIPALKTVKFWHDDTGSIICTFELPDNIIEELKNVLEEEILLG